MTCHDVSDVCPCFGENSATLGYLVIQGVLEPSLCEVGQMDKMRTSP